MKRIIALLTAVCFLSSHTPQARAEEPAATKWIKSAWQQTKDKTSKVYEAAKDKTDKFYEENKETIHAAGAAAAAIAIAVAAEKLGGSSASSSRPYSNLKDPGSVGSGKYFTPAQKQQILQENMSRNGGVLRSDLSGKPLTAPSQYTKGYSPSSYEAQVDHVVPRSAGGSNSFGNAQVLSREENLLKGASTGK